MEIFQLDDLALGKIFCSLEIGELRRVKECCRGQGLRKILRWRHKEMARQLRTALQPQQSLTTICHGIQSSNHRFQRLVARINERRERASEALSWVVA